jgi:cAMP-specific phosphodiesterase 4
MVFCLFVSHYLDFASKATLTTNKDDRMLVLKMALKCADIGHTSKTKELHLEWTQRVSEEFYRQGDEEAKHGLTVSPFMNRKDASIAKSQCGFIGFLVQPLFVSFAEQFPDIQPLVEQVDSNLNYWKKQELYP